MMPIDEYHPLVLRRERPLRYSPSEVREIMALMGDSDESVARRWRINPRTVRRMRDNGAEKVHAAALNAELRVFMFRPILYQRQMADALA